MQIVLVFFVSVSKHLIVFPRAELIQLVLQGVCNLRLSLAF